MYLKSTRRVPEKYWANAGKLKERTYKIQKKYQEFFLESEQKVMRKYLENVSRKDWEITKKVS